MPGVSVVEPAASDCADSGLESVIGDLLMPLDPDEEEDPLGGGGGGGGGGMSEEAEEVVVERVQEAVSEARAELRDFGETLELRVQERLQPLLDNLWELQQDNLRLRLQQERLVRQVDTLCQALQLPEPPPLVLPSPEEVAARYPDLSHMLGNGLILERNDAMTFNALEPGTAFGSHGVPGMPTVPSEEVSADMKPYMIPDAVDGLALDPMNGHGMTWQQLAEMPLGHPDGTPQDAKAVPHAPAFSMRRSSSTASMPTSVSRSNSMVWFHV